MASFTFKKTVCFLIFFFNLLILSAQNKTDTVIMTNGEKKVGKVVSVSENAIKFTYQGEALEYELKKSGISKIEFASGRTEIITNTDIPSASASTTTERKGRIAVLPFEFITNDSALNANAMAEQLQNDSYLSIKENTHGLQIQDPVTTNSILARNGIPYTSIKSKSPAEMAMLLGVENIVYGIANVTNKGTSSYGSGVSTYNGKETEKKEGNKEQTKSSGNIYNSNNATTIINYDTKISLNFYNDQGTNLYSESRNSFGTSFDAYHATINYLIKRCPFGSKVKN
ncbi:hypothetical protein ABS764_01175 [Flavobacterium sp. ST-87]|uniref:Uncharacterized protein n=1 Tax=Flavobacterium plantiphilum TaxID=3163297 RepID=A0ABW8XPA8_9FLAO